LLAGGKDIGAYGGILQGFFFDSFGPRRTLLVGGLLTAAGHAALYAQEYGWTDPFEGLCASWRSSRIPGKFNHWKRIISHAVLHVRGGSLLRGPWRYL
jgi:hypothetical protein